MNARARSLVRALVPAAAVATVALGLRVGARTDLRAALLFSAPPSAMKRGLAWQVRIVREEEGVREAAPLVPLVVTARARGREVTWTGTSNADGVAEVWLDLPDVAAGEPIDVKVTSPLDRFPLAEGTVRTDTDELRVELVPAFLTPSKREGPIALDVAVGDGRLTLGFASRIWVRAVDRVTGTPIGGLRIEAIPEGGLTIATSTVTTCESGWAELAGTAQGHVTGTTLTARDAAGKTGVWFGGIPVGLGASYIDLPVTAVAGPLDLDVVNPTARDIGYLEVDDTKGRAFASTLAFAHAPDGMLHAHVRIPPLAPGSYWVVTAGDPRGADRITGGSAVARPLRVVDPSLPDLACGARVAQALTQPRGFPRVLSLDGTREAYLRAAGTRRRGLFIAVGAIVIAALVEVLLFLRERRRSRDEAARAEAAMEAAGVTEEATALGLYGAPGTVFVGIGMTLLGFALLAAIVLYRGG